MSVTELGIILTADLAARARGRAFPLSDRDKYLRSGCGWVPANLAINVTGQISANDFGSVGDLRLMPDSSTQTLLELGHDNLSTEMYLADIHTPDGEPWAADPRTFLKNAIADLQETTGLRVVSSFEHEFMLLQEDARPVNTPFALQAFLEESPLGTQIMGALQAAGLQPEMWLPEFARNQFEVTLAPTTALQAADRAILLREIVHHVSRNLGKKVTFAPIIEPAGGGNGVHVHLSLQDSAGDFVTYDATKPGKLSAIAASFAAGILHYAEAISAVAAAGTISYERLTPNRWSAGGVFLGENNREALLRICPLFNTPGADHKKQFNLEYRAADATANPYLLLGCLIRAGLEGIKRNLPAPRVISGDISHLSLAAQQELGVRQIPQSLEEALDVFAASDVAQKWFAPELTATFLAVKRYELEHMRQLQQVDPRRVYEIYTAAY